MPEPMLTGRLARLTRTVRSSDILRKQPESPPTSSIDFSHGDVTAFPPPRWALTHLEAAFATGNDAYTDYRGSGRVREHLAEPLSDLLATQVDGARELIITPGTQGALFLALSALIDDGDPVAVVDPDYFATRRIVNYLGGSVVPVSLAYLDPDRPADLDLESLRDALSVRGARVICLSNPHNPTGVVFDRTTLGQVASLAQQFGAVVVIDQLYCRMIYPNGPDFVSMRSLDGMASNTVTLIGPSKTESLSGFRVGLAVAPSWLVARMEEILSIMALRAPGYSQAMLFGWLGDDRSWLDERIAAHQRIRDTLITSLEALAGLEVRRTEGGSYLFPRLPNLKVSPATFYDRLRVKAGVTVTSGSAFGERSEQSFRLNYSQDASRALAAMDRLVELAETLRAD